MTYAAKVHPIRSGETLTSIAARFGLSWQALYHHEANADFRRRNPDPNVIRSGDVIHIPPDPAQLLKERLLRLQTIRRETVRMYEELEQELRADYRQLIGRTSQAVDTSATVLLLGKGLAQMSAKGMNLMKLEGDQLARANREFMKTHLAKGTPGMQAAVGTVASTQLEPTGEEGLAWGVGKVLIKSWFDMTSPSYWASRITGWLTGQTPDQAFEAALGQLRRQRQQSLVHLDGRIAETQQLLARAQRERAQPMPMR